jgi:hypothetical protein
MKLIVYRKFAAVMLAGVASGLGGASCSSPAVPSLEHGHQDIQYEHVQLHAQTYNN